MKIYLNNIQRIMHGKNLLHTFPFEPIMMRRMPTLLNSTAGNDRIRNAFAAKLLAAAIARLGETVV